MNAPSLRLLLIAAVLVSACDNSEGPILEPDAGPDSGPVDSGPGIVDEEAPEVVDTTPPDGADDVSPSAPIVIRFSEPMGETGTLSLRANGEELTATRSWSSDGTELTLTAELPTSAFVDLVLERDFTDVAGNGLEAPFSLAFRTGDDVAPVVTETDPAEGSTVSARTSLIRISFSEPMDVSRGTLSLEGGPGELGEVAWTLGGLVVPVSGLVYDTEYRVVLNDFADPAGNALDGNAYLGDGALDFTTGPDMDPPRVLDANPSEGQIEVRDTIPTVTVLFDEPMDTSVREATLTVGSSSVTVTGTWSEGGTRIDFDVFGKLAPNATHSLSLVGFRDAAGNALDPEPHLADGVLDFVTGLDVFAPYVGGTDPVEGATDVSFRTSVITVMFSEAMDVSVTTVELTDGTNTYELEGVWSLAGTRLLVDVTGKLHANRSYRLSFPSFVDFGGTELDAEHPYLGDGVLDFTTAPPTGENCRDVLTVAEASSNAGGVVEWVIAPGVVTDVDGSNTCPGNGTPRADAVIRYTKTTPSASDGGTALYVNMVPVGGSGSGWIVASVLQNECDPNVVGMGPDRLRCTGNRNPQHLYLDVGPGDYYIWVSPYSGDFPEVTVRVEEVAAPPAGESCLAPYDTTTAAPIYTAPGTPDDPHVWTIPEGAVHGLDHAVAYNGPGAMACDTNNSNSVGVDAVIALPKSSDTSIGWLELETTNTSYDLVVQLLDRCDTMDPEAESLLCEPRLRGTSSSPKFVETTFTGAAGDRYFWLATDVSYAEFPGAIVRYKEIEPGPGDTCATAIPIDVGTTNVVTPNRPHRLPAPSCFDREETVTWYRFTTTEPFTHIRTDGDATIASIRAADGSETACQGTAAGEHTPLVVFEPTVGTDVCVAVASNSSVTSLALEAFPYDGNLGVATNLNIDRPLNSSGSPRPVTAQTWMAATPTMLYQGIGSQGVLAASIGGNVQADFFDTFSPLTPSNVLGSDAIAVGETIFSLDDRSGTSTVSQPRVYRIIRDGLLEPTEWDTGSSYPTTGMHAITYDGSSLLYATRGAAPTLFYSLSVSAPGPAMMILSKDDIRDVSGIAADAQYFYVVGKTESSTTTEGIFRISRTDPDAPTERLAWVDINTTRASIEIDDLTSPTYLYFRADNGAVHVISDPAGPNPIHLGPINTSVGNPTSETMTIDRSTGALYVVDTAGDATYYRLD